MTLVVNGFPIRGLPSEKVRTPSDLTKLQTDRIRAAYGLRAPDRVAADFACISVHLLRGWLSADPETAPEDVVAFQSMVRMARGEAAVTSLRILGKGGAAADGAPPCKEMVASHQWLLSRQYAEEFGRPSPIPAKIEATVQVGEYQKDPEHLGAALAALSRNGVSVTPEMRAKLGLPAEELKVSEPDSFSPPSDDEG